MTSPVLELVLALGGAGVGFLAGYTLARRRPRKPPMPPRLARFRTLRVAPGMRLDNGDLVALNENDEAVIVSVAPTDEVAVVVTDEVFGKRPGA